jgi:hypothetical protein
MRYLVEGLELLIRKVAYTKYDATGLVRWSNYTMAEKLAVKSWRKGRMPEVRRICNLVMSLNIGSLGLIISN